MDTQLRQAEIICDTKRFARRHIECGEEFGYLPNAGEQIYCVRHAPTGARIGQVLVAGCYAFSRERAYISWVRWARFLARHGLEVLRFDYRGSGESTGTFVEMDFDAWLDDTRCCARWLSDRGGGCPLVLHGFELGALLACKVFSQGIGDALLAWSPPASARDILSQALQCQKIQHYARRGPAWREGDQVLTEELEAGRPVVVGGCTISPRVWKQSSSLVFGEPQSGTRAGGAQGVRPCRVSHLDASAGPLCMSGGIIKPGQAEAGQLNPDLTGLFQENLDWICHHLTSYRRPHAPSSPN